MNLVLILVIYVYSVSGMIENRFFQPLEGGDVGNLLDFHKILANFIQTFLADEPLTLVFDAEDSRFFYEVVKQIRLSFSILNMQNPSNFVYFETAVDTTSNYVIFWANQTDGKTLDNLGLIMTNLKSLVNWNAHARYLMVISNSSGISPIIQLLWKLNIYNLVVTRLEDRSFFTWYPYEVANNCGANIITHGIPSDQFKHDSSPFKNKVPGNLNQCSFKLGWYSTEFLMHDPESNNPAAGNEFFASFTQARNLTMIYKHKPIYYAEVLKASTETSDLDMANKQIDISSFNLITTATYKKYDLSDNVFEMTNVWVVPQPTRKPLWKVMVLIFKKQVWIGLLLTLTLTSATWWIFGWILLEHQSFSMSIMAVGRTFLGIPISRPPETLAHKTLLVFSFSIYLTIMVEYASRMSSFLINPLFEPKLTNIEDLARTNLKLKFLDVNVQELVEGLDEETTTLIAHKHVSTALHPKEQLEDFLKHPTYATAITDIVLLHKLKDPSLIEKIYEKRWGPLRLKFVMPKGHPLIHRLNYMINLCHEVGLFKKWMRNSYLKTEKLETFSGGSRYLPLIIKDLQLGFGVLLIGLALSKLVFAFELLILMYLR